MRKAKQKHTRLSVTLPAADVAALIGAGEIAVTTATGTEVNRLAAERFLYHKRAVAAQLARQSAYQPIGNEPMPSERLGSFLSRLWATIYCAAIAGAVRFSAIMGGRDA
jgi:hypothetical protein